MKKLPFIIFLIAVVVISSLMENLGYGINTLQWWTSFTCVCVSYICGFIDGYKDKKWVSIN